MPELPDLRILQEAFQAALVGRPLTAWAAPQSIVVRGTPAEWAALIDRRLDSIVHRGKFLTFTFEGGDRIVINAMLTGRLGLAAPGSKAFGQTAVVMTFGSRAKAPAKTAKWTRGAAWLPAEDATIELRYRDTLKMGKIYLMPRGVVRPIAGWDEQGPDVDDATLSAEVWRERIARHSGEVKNLLKNQAFVAGIGNGYSDEILWAAGIAPFRKRSSLAPEEVDDLYRATREVPAWAIDELRTRVPPRFEIEVRDFLKVHRKRGSACPRCGTNLSEVSPGGFVTTWCRSCQR